MLCVETEKEETEEKEKEEAEEKREEEKEPRDASLKKNNPRSDVGNKLTPGLIPDFL